MLALEPLAQEIAGRLRQAAELYPDLAVGAEQDGRIEHLHLPAGAGEHRVVVRHGGAKRTHLSGVREAGDRQGRLPPHEVLLHLAEVGEHVVHERYPAGIARVDDQADGAIPAGITESLAPRVTTRPRRHEHYGHLTLRVDARLLHAETLERHRHELDGPVQLLEGGLPEDLVRVTGLEHVEQDGLDGGA